MNRTKTRQKDVLLWVLVLVLVSLLSACGGTVGKTAAPSSASPTPTAAPAGPSNLYASIIHNAGGGQDVLAFNAQTGQMLWQIKRTGEEIVGVNQNTVFTEAPSGAPEISSTLLLAYEAQTGNLRWRAQMDAYSITAITGDMLLLGERTDVSPHAHQVVALSARDGKVLWTYHSSAPTGTGYPFMELTVFKNTAFILAGANVYDGPCQLIALDITTGQALWEKTLPGVSRYLMADSQGVYFLSQGETPPLSSGDGPSFNAVTALSATTGEPRWQLQTQLIVAQPVSDGQALYLQTATLDKDHSPAEEHTMAVRPKDGQTLWSVPTDPGEMMAADGVLFTYEFPQEGPRVRALNGSDGSQRWEVPQPNRSNGVLLAAKGLVCLGFHEQTDSIEVYNASDGSLRWQYQAPNEGQEDWLVLWAASL